MGKKPSNYDPRNFKGTRGPAKSFSQEQNDAARAQAAGREPPPYDPVQHAAIGREMESRAKRWVMGLYENKGRSPMPVLSGAQWKEFQATGDVKGLLPGYGPHSAGPDDKEWTPVES